jgi:hypothetical protein
MHAFLPPQPLLQVRYVQLVWVVPFLEQAHWIDDTLLQLKDMYDAGRLRVGVTKTGLGSTSRAPASVSSPSTANGAGAGMPSGTSGPGRVSNPGPANGAPTPIPSVCNPRRVSNSGAAGGSWPLHLDLRVHVTRTTEAKVRPGNGRFSDISHVGYLSSGLCYKHPWYMDLPLVCHILGAVPGGDRLLAATAKCTRPVLSHNMFAGPVTCTTARTKSLHA